MALVIGSSRLAYGKALKEFGLHYYRNGPATGVSASRYNLGGITLITISDW